MNTMNERIAGLARKVLAGQSLSRPEGLEIAQVSGPDLHDLFYWSNRIRLHFVGPAVKCCSIVAGKVGACEQDCKFCSQSAHFQTHVKGTTRLGTEAIVDAARESARHGAACFGLVNSGLGPTDEEITLFADAMRKIDQDVPLDLCASLGVLTEAQAQRLAQLGVRKYNHNLQTSRRFFPHICSTHTYDQRLQTIRAITRAGIRACCGGLFGMGETWEDRVDLALQLRDLQVDTVPLNFLIPIPGTPLQNQAKLSTMECLRIIALYRFLLPRQTIKIAGGREVHLRDLQSWMFLAGANGFLIGNYLTTCGRAAAQDLQMLTDLELPLDNAAQPGDPARAVADQVARYVSVRNA